jgi:hypothetical protein
MDHALTVPWLHPDRITSSSNATAVTRPPWPRSVAMRRPDSAAHSRTAQPSPDTTLESSSWQHQVELKPAARASTSASSHLVGRARTCGVWVAWGGAGAGVGGAMERCAAALSS